MAKHVGRSHGPELMNVYMSRYDAVKQSEDYLKQRKDYESSAEGQFEEEIRDAVQTATQEEEAAFRKILDAIQKLKDDTFKIIDDRLRKMDEEIYCLPDSVIEEIYKQSFYALNKLKKMCSTPEYLAHLTQTNPSEYDKLFMMLIKKTDARFALFATKRSLDKVSYSFGKLSQENRDKLFARLEEFGLFEKENYFNAYKDIFKKQIEKSENYSYEV